jgi:hypothetical protein
MYQGTDGWRSIVAFFSFFFVLGLGVAFQMYFGASKCTRALTFENMWRAGASRRGVQGAQGFFFCEKEAP